MSKLQSEVWQKRSFPHVPMNERDPKPRTKSITEIWGPYYAMVTPTYTKELLEGMGEHVDGYKYAGGSAPHGITSAAGAASIPAPSSPMPSSSRQRPYL
jgi:hypothetical protein